MYRLKGNRPRPKGPLNIVISEYPKPVVNAENPERHAQSHNTSLNRDAMRRVMEEFLAHGTIDELSAWNEFLLSQGFTHFCTLTLGGKFTKTFAYRLLNQFIKDFYQELLGSHWYSPDNKKLQPLIFACADKGSDQKTSRKRRRQSQGLLPRHQTFTYSNDNTLHFHLVIKLSPELPLERVQKAIGAVPAIWKKLNKAFKTKICTEARIGPIEEEKKVIGYSLKNFSSLPVDPVKSPNSLGSHATQLTPPI